MPTMTERTDTAPIGGIGRSLRQRVQLTAGIVVAVAVALQALVRRGGRRTAAGRR